VELEDLIGTLYVVAGPIGNLEDITLRALRVLKEVSLVAAEDTRTAQNLLRHYDIHAPITSLFEHNEETKVGAILQALQGGDVALISEAGTPGLSDPGYRLIAATIAAGLPVVPIPGPSALTTALVVSGLPTDGFVFLGFLPRKPSARRALLSECQAERRTLVAYEAPHRLREALADIREILGDRQIAVARELTKLFEQVIRGTVSEAMNHFAQQPPRGEITLVIAGATEADSAAWTEERVRASLAELLAGQVSKSEAARQVAQRSHWPRQQVYRLAMDLSDAEQHGQEKE